jgi:GDPmannose 4,6-dehydratase
MKRALVVGVTGQDGAYLARQLLDQGYAVFGSSRDIDTCDKSRLKRLEVLDSVDLVTILPSDFRSVLRGVNLTKPDYIYNLSGQTSVALSYEQPAECFGSIATATLNFLECIRFLGCDIRFLNAGSSEIFGSTGLATVDEASRMNPCSPYGVAKVAAFWQVDSYRRAYGLHACTAILSNHESPIRPPRFVTRKIISAVKSIAAGEKKTLSLGNIDVYRDWGWAPEYTEAMRLMAEASKPCDYIVATGKTNSLEAFISEAFQMAGLNFEDHVRTDVVDKRPSEIICSRLNPARIRENLGWESRIYMKEVVKKMMNDEIF